MTAVTQTIFREFVVRTPDVALALAAYLKEVVMPSGEIITRRKSTTEMSVAEFSEFMQQVEAYAATELGVRFDE